MAIRKYLDDLDGDHDGRGGPEETARAMAALRRRGVGRDLTGGDAVDRPETSAAAVDAPRGPAILRSGHRVPGRRRGDRGGNLGRHRSAQVRSGVRT